MQLKKSFNGSLAYSSRFDYALFLGEIRKKKKNSTHADVQIE